MPNLETLIETYVDMIGLEGIPALIESANEYLAVNCHTNSSDYARNYSRIHLDAIRAARKAYKSLTPEQWNERFVGWN